MKRHSAVALEICESHSSMMCVLYHASIVSFSTFFHIFDILRNLWRFLSSVILHYIRYLAIEFLLIRWLLGTYYHIVAYVFICSTGFILLCALSGLFTIRNGFFNVMTKRINVKESWKNNIVHGKPNTRHDNNKAISNKRKNEEREREKKWCITIKVVSSVNVSDRCWVSVGRLSSFISFLSLLVFCAGFVPCVKYIFFFHSQCLSFSVLSTNVLLVCALLSVRTLLILWVFFFLFFDFETAFGFWCVGNKNPENKLFIIPIFMFYRMITGVPQNINRSHNVRFEFKWNCLWETCVFYLVFCRLPTWFTRNKWECLHSDLGRRIIFSLK